MTAPRHIPRACFGPPRLALDVFCLVAAALSACSGQPSEPQHDLRPRITIDAPAVVELVNALPETNGFGAIVRRRPDLRHPRHAPARAALIHDAAWFAGRIDGEERTVSGP